MPTIMALLDVEEGHSLAIFWLLKNFRARGDRVVCLGPPDMKNLTARYEFEFVEIMADIFPKGFSEKRKGTSIIDLQNLYFDKFASGELLDPLMKHLKCDVAIVPSYYPFEGLVLHYRYHLPIVFFAPFFRGQARKETCENHVTACMMYLTNGLPEFLQLLSFSGIPLRKFKDVAPLILQFPELMLLPAAFDFQGRPEEPGVHYIGAGVDLERIGETFSWMDVEPGRPFIYCALGSQGHLQSAASRRLFSTVMEVAVAHPDWDFLLSIGKTFNRNDFPDCPGNISLHEWVPQLRALMKSSVMINHAGFGTVKECVLMGVPMVAIPIFTDRDHIECAMRITHHGLGIHADIETLTAPRLSAQITQILLDGSFKERVDAMKESFKDQDRWDIAAKIIDESCRAAKN